MLAPDEKVPTRWPLWLPCAGNHNRQFHSPGMGLRNRLLPQYNTHKEFAREIINEKPTRRATGDGRS